MELAVLNVGTATIKAARYASTATAVRCIDRQVLPRRASDRIPDLCADGLRRIGADRETVSAVGHRIVHGGREFEQPVVIDASVEAKLEALAPLAPLHNPAALAGVHAARGLLPDRPMIAVFDTAFHSHRSEASRRYALPWKLADEFGLYRYGFHGIAHASLVDLLAGELNCEAADVDAVTLQLGSGCSACAVRGGRSVETSMGFSPLGGLAMPSRAGELDAEVVLHLLRCGHSVSQVDELLYRQSGLLGLADSADVRVLLAREAEGDDRAHVALELFVGRIVATVGAYWTLLDGRGALVFGGGIGSHSAEIRHRIAALLSGAWDVTLEASANASGRGRISTVPSRPVYVFETDEETQIARAVAQCVGADAR